MCRSSFKDSYLQTAFVYGEWYHNYDTFMTYKFLCAGRKMVYLNDPTLQGFLKSVDECKASISYHFKMFDKTIKNLTIFGPINQLD